MPGRIRMKLAMAGSVAISLALAGSVLGQAASAGPADAAAPSMASVESLAPPPASTDVAWLRVDGPWAGAGEILAGIATTPDGRATITSSFAGQDPSAWSSDDLAQWSRSVLRGEGRGTAVGIEAPWGVTTIEQRGATDAWLWVQDEDLGWTAGRRFGRRGFEGATAVGDQLVLFGYSGRFPKPKPALWSTSNGTALAAMSTQGLPGKGWVLDAAPTPDGSWLVITKTTGPGPIQLYLAGEDGAFDEQSLPMPDGTDVGYQNGALAATAGGVVMTTSHGGRTTAWFSETGTDWRIVAAAPLSLTLVEAGGLLLLPTMPSTNVLLATTDGVRWCSLPMPSAKDPADFDPAGAAWLPDGRLITVGSTAIHGRKEGPTLAQTAWVTAEPAICQ